MEGDSPFRFTTYAGEEQHQWSRMLASNPWRCMELALSDNKHADARAFLNQAHDFFVASESVGPTSRPLVLYYAFLNLAKTLIKIRSPSTDLKAAFHGITESSANREAQRFRLTAIDNSDPPIDANLSAGDKFILECAAGATGTGNATTWRQAGFSRHFAVVLSQLE